MEMIPAIQAFGLSELRGARAAIGIDKLVTRIMGELDEREVDRRFVRAAPKVCPTVSITDDGWCFSGPRRESRKERIQAIVRILHRHGEPLHFRPITERLNRGAKREPTPRAVYEFLRLNRGVFERVGRGTFWLAGCTSRQRSRGSAVLDSVS